MLNCSRAWPQVLAKLKGMVVGRVLALPTKTLIVSIYPLSNLAGAEYLSDEERTDKHYFPKS